VSRLELKAEGAREKARATELDEELKTLTVSLEAKASLVPNRTHPSVGTSTRYPCIIRIVCHMSNMLLALLGSHWRG
jgi:hypothetical protein